MLYGLDAGTDAMIDGGCDEESGSEEEKYRAGVMMGYRIGGLQTINDNTVSIKETGMKKISPLFIPACLTFLALRSPTAPLTLFSLAFAVNRSASSLEI